MALSWRRTALALAALTVLLVVGWLRTDEVLNHPPAAAEVHAASPRPVAGDEQEGIERAPQPNREMGAQLRESRRRGTAAEHLIDTPEDLAAAQVARTRLLERNIASLLSAASVARARGRTEQADLMLRRVVALRGR